MGRMPTTRSMALAICAACYCGARAFLAPASRTEAPKLAPGSVSAHAGGARLQSSDFSRSPSFMVLGTFLAGSAVALGQRQKQRTARRAVTYKQIDELQIEDIPDDYRPNATIGRSRRNFYKEVMQEELEDTFLLMAVNVYGMTIAGLEDFRNAMPIGVKARCLKNGIFKKAIENTGWECVSPKCRDQLMYIFVKEDNQVAPTVKNCLDFEKKWQRKAFLNQHYEQLPEVYADPPQPNTFAVFVDEWDVLDHKQIPKLKDFPTKETLVTRIAVGIKQVTTKLAKGVKQVPQKLAVGLKETVEKGEKDGKSSVGEVTP